MWFAKLGAKTRLGLLLNDADIFIESDYKNRVRINGTRRKWDAKCSFLNKGKVFNKNLLQMLGFKLFAKWIQSFEDQSSKTRLVWF